MSKYERIRFDGKTFKAKILSENDRFVMLAKVNNEGDETEEKTVKGVNHITHHLIEKPLIKKRTPLFMSHKYGTLETKPD